MKDSTSLTTSLFSILGDFEEGVTIFYNSILGLDEGKNSLFFLLKQVSMVALFPIIITYKEYTLFQDRYDFKNIINKKSKPIKIKY